MYGDTHDPSHEEKAETLPGHFRTVGSSMTEGNHNILDLDRMMTENSIILAFRDTINQDTLDGLYSIAEWRMESMESDRSVKKRIFNILIECLQNVVKHGKEDVKDVGPLVALAKENGQFVIFTANPIDNENLGKFKEKVQLINGIDHTDIRKVYSDRLSSAEFSDKGGAGLGLLDIYKKSGQKLEYEVNEIDNGVSLLTLKIKVAERENYRSV